MQTATVPGLPHGILGLDDMLSKVCDSQDFNGIHWRRLLAADCESPDSINQSLSFELSERHAGLSEHPIETEADIDSAILKINSLAFFKGGFQLVLWPRYFEHLKQRNRVTMDGLEVNKCKNIPIGSGVTSAGFGYRAWIVFKKLPVRRDTKETFLSELERKIWTDQILLPSVEACSSSKDWSRCPPSFADIKGKASAPGEVVFAGTRTIGYKLHVAGDSLERLWDEILRRCNESRRHHERLAPDAFSDPILIVEGHDLKVLFGARTPSQAARNYMEHFHDCFDSRYLDEDQSWVDVGFEHMPSPTGRRDGITLLYKKGCLDAWVKRFRGVEGRRVPLREEAYHFALCRDAGCRSIEFGPKSGWRKKGLAYSKAYNVEKVKLATPRKDLTVFENSRFNALAFSRSTLTDFCKERMASNEVLKPMDKAHTKKAFIRTKRRLQAAFEASTEKQMDYGCREEHRVRWWVLLALASSE